MYMKKIKLSAEIDVKHLNRIAALSNTPLIDSSNFEDFKELIISDEDLDGDGDALLGYSLPFLLAYGHRIDELKEEKK